MLGLTEKELIINEFRGGLHEAK